VITFTEGYVVTLEFAEAMVGALLPLVFPVDIQVRAPATRLQARPPRQRNTQRTLTVLV
jgi:hypothetical protein